MEITEKKQIKEKRIILFKWIIYVYEFSNNKNKLPKKTASNN